MSYFKSVPPKQLDPKSMLAFSKTDKSISQDSNKFHITGLCTMFLAKIVYRKKMQGDVSSYKISSKPEIHAFKKGF